MDIDHADGVTKWCFPINVQLMDKLNILNYNDRSALVMWNKYQILIYKNYDTKQNPIVLVPEFIISKLLMIANYLVCLDEAGNLHNEMLDLKNFACNEYSLNFKPKEQGIVGFSHEDDFIMCLQRFQNTFTLLLYGIQFGLKKENQCNLSFKTLTPGPKPLEMKGTIIFTHKILTNLETSSLNKVFPLNHTVMSDKSFLIVLALDHRFIFGSVFNKKNLDENIELCLLYSCPSEAADVQMSSEENNMNIVIGLKSGTFIILTLNDENLIPKIIHVNTSLYKYVTYESNIIYTDGHTLWKADSVFSDRRNTKQFFVTQVKDFLIHDRKIICVTFHNIVYIFSIDDDSSYLNCNQKHCHINAVLDTAEELYNEIMLEAKKNEEVLEKLKREENLTAALALSNKQNLMEKAILHKIVVYESYPDVVSECKNVILVNDLKDYFESNTFSISIQLELALEYQQKLNDILSNLSEQLQMHLTILSKGNLRTTSVKIDKIGKQANFLLPYKMNTNCELHLNVKLVSPICEAFDKNEIIWTIISSHNIKLCSEHFINTTENRIDNIQNFKKAQDNINVMFRNTLDKYYGLMYSFMEAESEDSKEYLFYILLPENYENIFIDRKSYECILNKTTAEYLSNKLGSDSFLKMHQSVILHVGETKIKVLIIADELSKKQLQISSTNVMVLLHFRSYFSTLLYSSNNAQSYLIAHAEYTALENLKRKLQTNLSSPIDEDTIMDIFEKFHKNDIGSLPL